MPQLTAGEARALEVEYVKHRAGVLAMLRADFGGLADHEELYQEAWAEALDIQARGGEIVNLSGLLRTIAWRRGRDRLRRQRPDAVDPASQVFAAQADPAAQPEEQVEVRLDAALIRQVVESLDPRQAAAIKLRFDCHLDAREIQRRLGVTPKRLEKIVTEAYQQVESSLRPDAGGSSEWRRRQRSLLLACETGLASPRQRRRAGDMVREDPVCRAMLHEIRSALEQLAAVLPLPLLAGGHGTLTRWRLSAGGRLQGMRDQLADWAARLAGRGVGAEQAGAGGAATAGGGAFVKTVLGCLAVAGGTAACLPGGAIVRHVRPPRAVAVVRAAGHQHALRETEPVAKVAAPRVAVARAVIAHIARQRSHKHHHATVTSAAAPTAPSPAPAGSTEFGPGVVGSSSAPATPSTAPTGGGGEFLP